MIYKYTFGNPIPTDTVVKDLMATDSGLVYLNKIQGEKIQYTYTMGEQDIVYGLGENVRGINKRGGIYESCCTDETQHTEDKKSLYAAHNFLIIDGKELFGVFFDYPGMIQFDIGHTFQNQLMITPEDDNLVLYLIDGHTVPDIIRQFREMVGRSYIPPKWAFGYGQSRWGYLDEKDIREVADNYRKNGIPLDMIYLDIDYMDHYKDFTINQKSFPDFKKLVDDLKHQGIRLIPIIDAGVKIEEGYSIYEEGVKGGYFCKDKDGNDFVAGVWPGNVHFPDVLNKDARKWFGHQYKFLLDQGIEGFWNDMNEPSIFYSEEHLKEVLDELDDFKGKNMDLQTFSHFQGMVKEITNNREDYKRLYHDLDGLRVRHDKVHNLYGYNVTRAAAEAFEDLEPNKRFLLFSRSSCIGMHRYGGIWTGDNVSWWSHLLLNIKMMPSLNMCGLLFSGADIGGFAGDTTQDLLLRWLEFGIFAPLMRNHSCLNTRHQEVYCFEKTDTFRKILEIRYGLLPYIYSEFVKAAVGSGMYFKPLAFDYPEDPFVTQVEDQLLIGNELMIAPVYQQNSTGRYVYLPERMKMYKLKSLQEMESRILEKGHHYIEIALDELVIFVRPNSIIPFTYSALFVDGLEENELFAFGFIENEASYLLYQDDGLGKDFDNPDHYSRINVKADGTCSIDGNRSIKIHQIF
jgi:alpha-glucosidase